jgi:hypothetical protein
MNVISRYGPAPSALLAGAVLALTATTTSAEPFAARTAHGGAAQALHRSSLDSGPGGRGYMGVVWRRSLQAAREAGELDAATRATLGRVRAILKRTRDAHSRFAQHHDLEPVYRFALAAQEQLVGLDAEILEAENELLARRTRLEGLLTTGSTSGSAKDATGPFGLEEFLLDEVPPEARELPAEASPELQREHHDARFLARAIAEAREREAEVRDSFQSKMIEHYPQLAVASQIHAQGIAAARAAIEGGDGAVVTQGQLAVAWVLEAETARAEHAARRFQESIERQGRGRVLRDLRDDHEGRGPGTIAVRGGV